MGTNYYHRTNICAECGHYDERHIGKSSIGWQFSFRGYNIDRDDFDEEAKPIIASWQDWKEVLKEGKIFDEYGKEWSYDDFIAKVEKTKGKQNHYDYLCDSPQYGAPYLIDMWKDAEGWDFSSMEFS